LQPRSLIINADDCNLTPGVTRGILRSHDHGILTSTTLLMNLPLSEKTVKELKKRSKLGLGVHLNVTLGKPLSSSSKVRSLLKAEGRFRRPTDYFQKMPSVNEVTREYEAQVELFQKRFHQKPDHLDTHHHLHDFPVFFTALSKVARKWKLPIRRSRVFQLAENETQIKGLKTTDFLFGNLEARFIWEKNPFLGIAENLPDGTSEIGCHPGYSDAELRSTSSLTDVREKELKLFSDPSLRAQLTALGIQLIRFSEI